MSAEPAALAVAAPVEPVPAAAPPDTLLTIPAYRLLLVVQVLFWASSAVFLMLPKYLAVDLHAGAGGIGLAMGALGGGAVLASPFIGVLTGWCGRRHCLVLANLGMAVGALLFIAVETVGPLAIVARALQGAAGALLYAHGTVLVADLVPRHRLPSAIALYMTAGLIPNVLSPPAAEWLLAAHGPEWVFAGAGLLALGGALLAGRLPERTAAPQVVGGLGRSRPVLPLLVVSLLFGAAAGTVFAFHQPLAIARGAQQVSDFLVAFTLTAAGLRLAGGRLIDRLGSPRVACWTGAGYAVALVALCAVQPGSLVWLGVLFGATHGLFFPTFVAYALGDGGGEREGRMAWIGATDKLGHLMVIPLGLLAAAWGYVAVFLLVAATTAGAALALHRSAGQR